MATKYECNDFNTNMRLDRIRGMTEVVVQGRASALGTTTQSLYNHASVAATKALHDTPAVVKVASSSTNDDVAGSGALTVRITGVDANDAVITEDKILTGQTEVTTTAAFKGINEVRVLTAGAGGVNAGDIWVGTGTFTAGVPATKYSHIEVGANVGNAGVYHVPVGKQALLDKVIAKVSATGKFIEGRIVHLHADTGLEATADFLDLAVGDVQYEGHHTFAAGEYLRVEAATDSTTAGFSIEMLLTLVDV